MHTFCSLEKWHHSIFERVGWLVLAPKKLEHFKQEIRDLMLEIQRQNQTVVDTDHRNDLITMYNNVNDLQTFVDTVWPSQDF